MRVEIPAPGDLIMDDAGNVRSNVTVSLKLAGTSTDVTHYSALTGGTSTTGGLKSGSDGTIVDGSGNRRYIDSGAALDLTIDGRSRQLDPISASVESRIPFLNVKDPQFGAKGDGLTNDTAAIQAALTQAAILGGAVYCPAGTYVIGSGLTLPSGGHLFGESSKLTQFLVWNGWSNEAAITASGSSASQINIVGTLTNGDTDVTAASSHSLAVGDWVRLVSQRDSLNETDGGEFYLGTAGTNYVFFGEFLKAGAVGSGTTFTSETPIIYPGYKDTNVGETSVNARASSTIEKVSFSNAPTVEKIGFVTQGSPSFTSGRGAVVSFIRARDGIVRDCDFDMGSYDGYAVTFRDSMRCRGVRIAVNRDQNAMSTHNSLKHVSSQECVFDDCDLNGGYQPIDITYYSTAGGVCSTFCGAVRCRVTSSIDAAMTTHNGTYGCFFHSNFASGGQKGAYIRGNSHSVRNNDFSNMTSAAVWMDTTRRVAIIGNTGFQLGNGIILGGSSSSVHDAYIADNWFRARLSGVGNGVWGQSTAIDTVRVVVKGGRYEGFAAGAYIGTNAVGWSVDNMETPSCTAPITLISSDTTHRFSNNNPSGTPTQLEETWKKIEPKGGQMDALSSNRVLLPDATVGSTGTNVRAAIYLDPADYAVMGRTTKLRVEATVITNDTAPGMSFTIDLRPLTTPVGAAAVVAGTVGGSATATAGTFTTPAANSITRRAGTEIAFPTAGLYVLYVGVSTGMAANSSVVIRANLAVRHDST